MKILMICTVEFNKNGISTFIYNYCEKLKSLNCAIDILTVNGANAEMKNYLNKQDINVYELKARNENTLIYFLKLMKFLRKGGYDILHVHGNSCTMAIELFAGLLAGCGVRIAHSHNTTCEHMKVHKLLRPLFDRVCNGRFACGKKAGEWLFPKEDFFVINNGIDLEKYKYDENIRTQMRERLKIENNEILLGHIGVFNYQKNHEFLIEVMSGLCKNENNYKLLCIGDGEFKEKLENQAIEKGIQEKVIFVGNVSNVEEYLQAMDYFLLPSRFEGLPYVLIEAQAAGLPCYVSEYVSPEVKIANNLFFLPLEEEKWEKILKENAMRERTDNIIKLKKAGFDLVNNSLILLDEYKKLKYNI